MHIIHYLLLLFIVVPVIELLILFKVGGAFGAINTFAVIIITGIIGAYLAKQQGLRTLQKIRASLSAGHLPGVEIVDGLIILVAGAVLLTPGFLTDITGFLLLLPAGRKLLRVVLLNRFTKFIKSGKFSATASGGTFHVGTGTNETIRTHDKKEEIIDIEGKEIE